tara:strand:+ start:554 stop:751 length:198 start_codon:yes stop_codon:yes gene_type:complete
MPRKTFDSIENSARFLIGKPLKERDELLKKWACMIGESYAAKVKKRFKELVKQRNDKAAKAKGFI